MNVETKTRWAWELRGPQTTPSQLPVLLGTLVGTGVISKGLG